jgi:hypothetical protein
MKHRSLSSNLITNPLHPPTAPPPPKKSRKGKKEKYRCKKVYSRGKLTPDYIRIYP